MPIAPFLTDVESLLKQGVATEHTYRPLLKTLFEQIIPGAHAINEPKHATYGAPDFLLQQGAITIGHVEAKDIGVDLNKSITDSERDLPKTANGKQLQRYRAALPNLLYTDGLVWHWFVDGKPRLNEPLCIATWNKNKQTLTPSPTAATDLVTLLEQFAAHTGVLVGTPNDLAQRLARIARWLNEVINTILTTESEQGSLHQQLTVFRHTLLPNLTPAEFADMYAQTLAYGLFAARIASPDKSTFTRHDAAQTIPQTNPFLQEMFHQIAGPRLDTRIAWLVDDCARFLEHTDMSKVLHNFGKATMQQDPVVHFYETFLAAYDPKTRDMRGVYYTPEPVVSYIVRSVDHLLQTHFSKPMGLADGDTIILDPATGTATFLHAIVQHIYATLQSMGLADTWNHYVPEKLLPRLFGFELLMAPYTVAHLKLSMVLQQLGYDFSSNERLGIYLTNTLIELPEAQTALPFANFIVEEGQQARDVKQKKPVMVIIGNPPYSNYGMLNKGEWIQAQLQDYKHGLQEKKLNLDDDFIKFIRFGQWRIEQTGQGILAFITNNTYIDGITRRRMRESLMETFTDIYILDLHGSSMRKEVCPDGSPDENVFDIRQGVAIGIFVKERGKTRPARVHHAELWGTKKSKYATLATMDIVTTNWQEIEPTATHSFFVPRAFRLQQEYTAYMHLKDIFPLPAPGMQTQRDKVAIQWTQSDIEHVIHDFKTMDVQDIRSKYKLPEDSRDWQVAKAKSDVLKHSDQEWYRPVLNRPFDIRHTWYSGQSRGFIGTPSFPILKHMLEENIGLLVTRQLSTQVFRHVFVSETLATRDALSLATREANQVFPLYLYPNGNEHPDLFDFHNGRRPNLSAAFVRDMEQRLKLTFIPDGMGNLDTTIGPEDIFHYLYAVLHSPTYRTRYAEFLKVDFPRVPLPNDNDKTRFKTVVAYGATLVDLHLLRIPGGGASTVVCGAGGAPILLNPGEQGIAQHQATTAPVDSVSYDDHQHRVVLGNDRYFSGIEPTIWEIQIGGYQPLHKWLKDRIGRTLSFDEVLHYMRMVIALRETQRIMDEIDGVIGDR